jgi:hypothetical protein
VNECIDEDERGVAGMFTGLVLNAGLVLGASVALIFE